MIISFVTDAFAVWGGMERVLADKMNYLAAQYGYDVVLLTVNQGTHDIPFKLNTAIKHIDLGVGMHQQYAYHGIARLLKRQKLNRQLKQKMSEAIFKLKPDVIICVKLDFVGLLSKVKGKIPLIVESHTMFRSESIDGSGWLRRLHVWSFKNNVRMADAVVALTEGDANDWRQINEHVFVIPNVVNLSESDSIASLQNKSVIFVGRFSVQKDIGSLLRIWKIVHQRYPNWSLNIYGDGELKDYYLPIINSLNANVLVFEPVEQIMDRYMENSILLLTSLYEPFGLVLPEAMSCGLPVVSFDCPYGPSSIITDGVDGLLEKDRDIDAFADKVCRLIEDQNLRQRMGQTAILSAQRYSADKIMPKWKVLFDELVSRSNAQ